MMDDVKASLSYVIGIGASAGSLEPLQRFLETFPAGADMAVVIVAHLSAERESALPELLEPHSQMPVEVVVDETRVMPGRVYMLPPAHNLELRDETFVLTPRMDADGTRTNYPIDQFFLSLALHERERAVGIVLSGTGTDGAHGASAIHAAGGLVFAEDPDSAKFGSMPLAAIHTSAVTHWCAAADLPAAVLRHLGVLERGEELPEYGLDRIVTHVSRHVGVDFHAYKRSTLHRRVERRRLATDSATLDAYAELVERSPHECERLGQDMLVGVTLFFRDAAAFASVESLLPDLLAEVARRPNPLVRLWVPGCSTGEEVYSLGIILAEAIDRTELPVDFKIFATDVNTDALAIAGRAHYPPSLKASVSQARLRRFFTAEPDGYEIRPFIRERMVFARHDVLRDPPFTRLDFISCRNLLIYLDGSAQSRATQVFRFGLLPGGVLLLGQSETISSEAFSALDERHRLYKMAKPSILRRRPSRGLPSRSRTPTEPPPRVPVAPPVAALGGGTWMLERTLEHLGAPALVLKDDGELAYAFGDIAHALRVPSGRAGWKAMDLLPPETAAVVSAAIARAKHLREPISVNEFSLESEGGRYQGSLRVVPLAQRSGEPEAVALLFDAPWGPSEASPISIDEAMRNRVQQLEAELSRAHLELQRSQEELETSTEELHATNEELFASNEELQTTNEELQSVNEELHTVNSELQFKVEELSQLSNDLEHLLRAVRGGLLFLDRRGRIRRYNEAILDVLPLVPHDEGRPIGDIAHNLIDVDLGREVTRVVQTQLGYEREVLTRDRRSYSLSLQPYVHAEGGYEGVVLTLNDVSSLSEANARLRNYLRLIDQSPAPTVVASAEGGIEFTNAAYTQLTGLDADALAGQAFSKLFHPDTAPAAKVAITKVVGTQPWQGEVQLRCSGGEGLSARVSVFSVVGEPGETARIALTCVTPV